MLVLSRRRGEAIVIGDGVTVTILEVHGERVKLGFAAPAEVPIYRKEIYRTMEGRLPTLTHAACGQALVANPPHQDSFA